MVGVATGCGGRIVTGYARRQGPQEREQSNTFAIIGVILLGQACGGGVANETGLGYRGHDATS